jgi:protein O-mannosyl-transferase
MFSYNITVKLTIGYSITLLLLILFSYSNYTTHTFLHWDDINYILRTEFLRPLTINNIIRMFSEFSTSNWHPITWLSYGINFSIWGENAPAFKMTNIVIHFLNSLLVFYLSYLILGIAKYSRINPLSQTPSINNRHELLASMIAALLFAIHPQHVESVAWISGRKDLLCALFYFLTIIAYLHQHYSDKKSFWRNIASLSFVLALMSKSMAVTLPVVLIILDIYPLKKIKHDLSLLDRAKHLADGKLIYFFLAGAVLMITLITQTSNITGVQEYTLSSRIANSATNYFYYIYSIANPNTLSPYHPLRSVADNTSWSRWAPSLLFILVFVASYIASRKNYKFPLVILVSYLVMLLPVIGLLHLGHAARADRYTYIPTTGFYILIGFAVAQVSFALTRYRLRLALLSLVILAVTISLSFTTYQYNKDWKNDRTVWQKVIDKYPNSAATAYVNLGNVLFLEKQYQAAIKSYKNAIRVDPIHLEAMRNLGATYEEMNDNENAEKYYNMMVEVRPGVHYPYTVVGDFYFKNKMYPKAAFYYQKALEISPSSENALYKNSLIDLLNGDLDKAEQKIDYLLQLRPYDIEGLQMKAQIKYAQKDYKTAIEIANAILKKYPANVVANHIITTVNSITN